MLYFVWFIFKIVNCRCVMILSLSSSYSCFTTHKVIFKLSTLISFEIKSTSHQYMEDLLIEADHSYSCIEKLIKISKIKTLQRAAITCEVHWQTMPTPVTDLPCYVLDKSIQACNPIRNWASQTGLNISSHKKINKIVFVGKHMEWFCMRVIF